MCRLTAVLYKSMDTKKIANDIRKRVLKMTSDAQSSHVGSNFSVIDIVAILYFKILNLDPKNPTWPERDRFILSKGHAGASVYAALAERGFFDKKELETYYKNGSKFSGHVSHKDIPGVELSTGALGHGLLVANGMAFNAKVRKQRHKIFVILSDGECNEGSVWEAALFSGHHKLDNLIVIIDYNKIQCIGRVKEVLDLEPFVDKWKSFGFSVKEVDGHNHNSLEECLLEAKKTKGKPTCIIAHTIKGKGVSFMEDDILWHFRSAQGEEYERALKELEL